MKSFFSPNITRIGRWVRAGYALVMFIAAGFAFRYSGWLALVLVLCGALAVFEALRGWCVLRACGIKTKV